MQPDAAEVMVGSVMSSWNHFNHTGRTEIQRAEDCWVWDAEGTRRLDWIMGWGSLMLGHTPRALHQAAQDSIPLGFGYQYESPHNIELATEICDLVPSAEKVRLTNSGLEATLYALRLARAVTGRQKVLKFEGHFHGLNDFLLWSVDGSPTLGARDADGLVQPVAGSGGLPDAMAELLLVAPFNDIDAVERAFARHPDDIAAIILEPIMLNVGCVYPHEGFLQALRQLCDEYGTILIFDEILTGFRGHSGGAQAHFDVTPDLTCIGKALGCGAPGAAVCGRADVMDAMSPVGGMDMAGTNTARQLTTMLTLAAVRAMRQSDLWSTLRRHNTYFVDAARNIFAERGVPAHIEGFGGRIGVHIGSDERPRDFEHVTQLWNADYHIEIYRKAHEQHPFFGFLLPLGICPEPVTLSGVHDRTVLDDTLHRLDDILATTPYRVR